MPFVTKNGGHGGPTLQNVGGQSKQMGPLAPWPPLISMAACFSRLVTEPSTAMLQLDVSRHDKLAMQTADNTQRPET